MKISIASATFLGVLLAGAGNASATDAAGLCDYVTRTVAGANEQSGKMIDQITRGETATFDCDQKVAAFKWSVMVPAAQLSEGWQEKLKGSIEKIACGDETLKEAMASGWKMTATWTPSEGDAYTAELSCP